MKYTLKQAQKKHPGVHFYGDYFYIGEGADIGAGAFIGAGADIRAGAFIREGAFILTVCSKYICNIIPYKDRVEIRIGCESHTVEDWEKLKEALADKHDREWWDKTGARIYEFLKGEVAQYLKDYPLSIKGGK